MSWSCAERDVRQDPGKISDLVESGTLIVGERMYTRIRLSPLYKRM